MWFKIRICFTILPYLPYHTCYSIYNVACYIWVYWMFNYEAYTYAFMCLVLSTVRLFPLLVERSTCGCHRVLSWWTPIMTLLLSGEATCSMASSGCTLAKQCGSKRHQHLCWTQRPGMNKMTSCLLPWWECPGCRRVPWKLPPFSRCDFVGIIEGFFCWICPLIEFDWLLLHCCWLLAWMIPSFSYFWMRCLQVAMTQCYKFPESGPSMPLVATACVARRVFTRMGSHGHISTPSLLSTRQS